MSRGDKPYIYGTTDKLAKHAGLITGSDELQVLADNLVDQPIQTETTSATGTVRYQRKQI